MRTRKTPNADTFHAVNVHQTFIIISNVYISFAAPLFDERRVNLYATDIQVKSKSRGHIKK